MQARAAVISALAIALVLVLPTEAWAKPKPPRADADAIRACHLNNQLATVVLLGNSNPQDPPYASIYATVANQFARSKTKGARKLAKVMAGATSQLDREAALAKSYQYCASIGQGNIALPTTS
jgi:hypothetical protein